MSDPKESQDDMGATHNRLPSIGSHRSIQNTPTSKFMKADASPNNKIVAATVPASPSELEMIQNPKQNAGSNKVNPHPGGNLSVESGVHANFNEDKPLLVKKDSNENEAAKGDKSFMAKMKARIFGDDTPKVDDPTIADSPGFRNKQIAQFEPYEYQHMFHIKNLRKIKGLKDLKSNKIIAEEDQDMINAQMMPFACNGNLFTILYNYERASKNKEFEGRTYLRIL